MAGSAAGSCGRPLRRWAWRVSAARNCVNPNEPLAMAHSAHAPKTETAAVARMGTQEYLHACVHVVPPCPAQMSTPSGRPCACSWCAPPVLHGRYWVPGQGCAVVTSVHSHSWIDTYVRPLGPPRCMQPGPQYCTATGFAAASLQLSRSGKLSWYFTALQTHHP